MSFPPVTVDRWLTVPEVAEHLAVSVTTVRQHIRDGQLLAFRAEAGEPLVVPGDLLQEGQIVKSLPGVISLLRDGRFGDDEILVWLTTPDDSLPGTPLGALRANRGTEVKRRAQAEL